MTNPQDLITRTRKLCEAATPGQLELVIRTHPSGDFADFKYLPDSFLHAAAPELLMELADALKTVTRERDEARAECKSLSNKLYQANEHISMLTGIERPS